VDSYLDVTDLVETDIDATEEDIFSPLTNTNIECIYLLKREVVELRRAINPLTLALQRMGTDHNDLISIEVRRYMRDVLDHNIAASDRITSYDELLSSLVQAAVGKVAMQQNIDMRKISAWVAIAAVPTAIAGIYGMNFDQRPRRRVRADRRRRPPPAFGGGRVRAGRSTRSLACRPPLTRAPWPARRHECTCRAAVYRRHKLRNRPWRAPPGRESVWRRGGSVESALLPAATAAGRERTAYPNLLEPAMPSWAFVNATRGQPSAMSLIVVITASVFMARLIDVTRRCRARRVPPPRSTPIYAPYIATRPDEDVRSRWRFTRKRLARKRSGSLPWPCWPLNLVGGG
jgi:hypothetical protein